jgi:hypothetical protein
MLRSCHRSPGRLRPRTRVHRPNRRSWRQRPRLVDGPEGCGQPQWQRRRVLCVLPVRAAKLLSPSHIGDGPGVAGRRSAGTANGRLPRPPTPNPRRAGNSRGGLGRARGHRATSGGTRR